MTEIVLEREKLYELVWSKPMIKIAKDYGMSDNGIRKICRKFNIPTPEIGHWQKIEHGKRVKQKPLPKAKSDSEIVLTSRKPEYTKIISDEELMIKEVHAEYYPQNKITVSEKLTNPHSLIKEFQKKVNKNNRYRGLIVSPRGSLCIKVSPDQLSRALRIMDALIKAFEKREMKVGIEAEDCKSRMFVSVLDQKVPFDLYEKVKNVYTGEDNFGYKQYDHVPSGVFALRIKDFVWDARREWKDSKTKLLEECLNSFIRGLYKVALIEKARNEQFKRERDAEKEKYLQLEKLQKQAEEERSRFQKLEADAFNWQKSQIIKSYIEAAKKDYIEKNGEIEEGSEFDEWVKWAKKYGNQLNPLN